jgi:hypothetical protein
MSEDSDKRFDPVYTWSGQPKRFEELSWGRQVYLSIYWGFGGLMLIIAAYFSHWSHSLRGRSDSGMAFSSVQH